MALKFESRGLKPIGEVEIPDDFYNRYKTGNDEIDNFFGEGLFPGSTITLCAKAGCGKSTFVLQLLEIFEEAGRRTAYITNEVSREQAAWNSRRIGVKRVPVDAMTDIDDICQLIEDEQLEILVLDSAFHVTTRKEMNTKQKMKYMTDRLCATAQETKCVIFIIMHVTKAGILKGDTYTPHTVDVNMVIRNGEDEYGDREVRILEIPEKNRFGTEDIESKYIENFLDFFHPVVIYRCRCQCCDSTCSSNNSSNCSHHTSGIFL
jgi:DNA repair protein RadA/Sms